MVYVLGIDGGGSKTVCVLMDEQGQVFGRGEAGGSNYQSVGIEVAAQSIKAAISAAVETVVDTVGDITIKAICLGLAGVGRPGDFKIVKDIVEDLQQDNNFYINWSLKENNIIICNDALIALVGGIGDDVGVVAAAGTGSIVFGRNYQGLTKRVGGWGYILGDEGGAYKIAVAGLQAAMRYYDGRDRETCLTRDFQEFFALENIEYLVDIVYRGGGVKEIAALAPIVDNAAANGDDVANDIVDGAVGDLLLATSTVINAIFQRRDILEVVTVGSVWGGKSMIRSRFETAIIKLFPTVKVIYPRFEPAFGAGLLALKSLVSG